MIVSCPVINGEAPDWMKEGYASEMDRNLAHASMGAGGGATGFNFTPNDRRNWYKGNDPYNGTMWGTQLDVNKFYANKGGAQGGGGGLNTANDWLGYAGYGEAVLRGVQMGMVLYRQSLSISSKIGTFSNFSTAYRVLGTTGKVLGGAANWVGAPINTLIDYNSMKNGEIGGSRFGYRTAGTAVGIGVGAYFGAIPGAVIGGGFWAGEKTYDGYMYWQTQMSIYMTNFENGLKNGWVPGR